MPHRFRQASFAVICVMASWLLVGLPAAATPSPAPGPVPGVLSGDSCSRASTPQVPPPWEAPPACASRPAPRLEHRRRHLQRHLQLQSQLHAGGPGLPPANNFFGTLYMGGADFTGSLSASRQRPHGCRWVQSGDRHHPNAGRPALSAVFNADWPRVPACTRLQLRVGEHADGVSVRTEFYGAMDFAVDFEGSRTATLSTTQGPS